MKKFAIVALLAGILTAPGIVFADWMKVGVPLSDVKCLSFPPSSDTGWACGNFAVPGFRYVSRTTDGGVTWELLPDSSIDVELYSIVFPTGTATGFTAGFHGGDHGVIYRTTDAGMSWDSVGQGYVTALDFAPGTDSVGWATAGNLFYSTTDAGTSWHVHSYPAGVCNAIRFVNRTTGWMCGSGGAIYRTTNSGAGWTNQYSGTNHNLQAISFPTADTGFIAGESVVLRTTNGGVRWDSVHVYVGYDTSSHAGLRSVEFPAGTRVGYVCGDYGIYKTTDGGVTWFNPGAPTDDYCLCLNFTDDLTGCIGGEDMNNPHRGFVLQTTDGGTGVEVGSPSRRVEARGELRISPNPFRSSARIGGHETETFSAYDVSGRKAGTYTGRSVGGDLSPGIYFVRSQSGNEPAERIVKLR